MKTSITTTKKIPYKGLPTFDSTVNSQLVEILKEQGFDVGVKTYTHLKEPFDEIDTINGRKVYIWGKEGSVLNISSTLCITKYRETVAKIIVNKNINFNKFNENILQILSEIKTKEERKNTAEIRKTLIENLVSWSAHHTEYGWVLEHHYSGKLLIRSITMPEISHDNIKYELNLATFEITNFHVGLEAKGMNLSKMSEIDKVIEKLETIKAIISLNSMQNFLNDMKTFTNSL